MIQPKRATISPEFADATISECIAVIAGLSTYLDHIIEVGCAPPSSPEPTTARLQLGDDAVFRLHYSHSFLSMLETTLVSATETANDLLALSEFGQLTAFFDTPHFVDLAASLRALETRLSVYTHFVQIARSQL